MLSSADYADLAADSPLAIRAQIKSAAKLPPARAQGTPPGYQRFYVEATVLTLIRGQAGLPQLVSYLYDAPLDARGKPPKLKKRQVLIFARPGGRADQIQLIARNGQIDWTPEAEANVRGLIQEAVAPNAPPPISGIVEAFHVPGAVAGESETQIFLRTATGAPVSLSIIRRPGEQPHWAVALGEIVDESASTPRRGGLLWYRLACGLPATLPGAAVSALDPTAADAARADYAVVLQGLGPCGRTPARVAGAR